MPTLIDSAGNKYSYTRLVQHDASISLDDGLLVLQGTLSDYTIDNGTVITMPPLAQSRANKLAEINIAANAALSALTAGYPDLEVSTWDQQLAEAKLVAASPALAQPLAEGASDSIPFLRQLATARESLGATPAERVVAQAAKILANAAAWAAASGAIVGRRLALEDAVDAAETPEAVAAIVVDFA